jgi:hypothetical protein
LGFSLSHFHMCLQYTLDSSPLHSPSSPSPNWISLSIAELSLEV